MIYQRLYTSALIGSLCIMGSIKSAAQNDYIQKAEKLFADGNYNSAIPYYHKYLVAKGKGKLLKQNKKNESDYPASKVAFQLADCYRKTYDYQQAESWYDSVIALNATAKYPMVTYWRAVCLRANNKLSLAKTAFKSYIASCNDKDALCSAAKKELADIDFAEQELAKKSRRKVVLSKLKEPINTESNSYAPVVLNQHIYFSSSRADTSIHSARINPYQHHVYCADLNGLNYKKVSFLQDKNIEQGAAVFTTDGNTVFITQWIKENNQKVAAIFKSTKTNDSWSTPVKMDSIINVKGFSSQQPFISKDGKYLFFSSNRPGGIGNFDIWVAELKTGYEPISVNCLDRSVNTVNDEKAPYFDTKNEILVFSSNGRTGMGGYDLYSSKKASEKYIEAVNLGAPANSTKDDVYFYSNNNADDLLADAYFSSDRNSNCCMELYNLQRFPAPLNHITGTVRNVNTKEIIPGATLQWNNRGQIKTINTNDKGAYSIAVPDTAFYKVSIQRAKYEDTAFVVKHVFELITDTLYNVDIMLQSIPEKAPAPEIIKDYQVYFDFDKSGLSNEAKKVLDSVAEKLIANPKWKIALAGYTDGKGSELYNLKLSQRRTDACLKYLAEKKVDATRLLPSFYGKNKLLAINETSEGKDNPAARQLNRRVKLSVIKE